MARFYTAQMAIFCASLLMIAAGCQQTVGNPNGGAHQQQTPHGTVDRTHGPSEQIVVRPADVAWQDGPPSLPAGAQYAVLEGDPAKPGVFTMRIKLPNGYQVPPHWHPNVERITVLAGTFFLGHGETFDRTNAERLEAGSYTAMPSGMRHFAFVEGETILQLSTIGPWEIHYINPADDPRRR